MKKSAIINNSVTETGILSVSPVEADHGALQAIFRQDSRSGHGIERKCKLYARATREAALTMMRDNRISIIVCERDLRRGTWKELLEQTAIMPDPPLIIVTSRLADERLWAEVLNLGGWDVLAKPFDRTEVIRVVRAAWWHWDNHHASLEAQVQRAWLAAS